MNHKTDMQAPTEIYVWFADNKGTERDGERFIRAWTMDPVRADGLRGAIGKAPAVYRAIEASQSAGVPDGWKIIRVNDHFDALIASLERAESKGYLPDAIAEEWGNFACDENIAAPAAPAPVSEPADLPEGCDAPEKQTLHAPQMQRAFNRAAEALREDVVEQPNECGEPQDCPHGVDDGACKQCYGEAVSGEQWAAFEYIRDALHETYGFASTSPRGQENINFALGKLDEIEGAMRAYLGPKYCPPSSEPDDSFLSPVSVAAPQPQAAESNGMTVQDIRLLAMRYAENYTEFGDGSLHTIDFGGYGFANFAHALLAKGE